MDTCTTSPGSAPALTPRLQRLRERMNTGTHVHHRTWIPAAWSTAQLPCSLAERKALIVKRMCEEMPIFIDADEWIVGSRTALPAGDRSRALAENYRNVNLYAGVPFRTQEEEAATRAGRSDTTHRLAGYGKVLELGLGGLSRQASARRDGEMDAAKSSFLNAIIIALQGPAILARRYATLATELAQAASAERRQELHGIARTCAAVGDGGPPGNLQEVLQLFWFAHLTILMENYTLMTYGRFDQHLAPFWNSVPETQARELLACLLIKMNDTIDVPGVESENLVLAGYRPDGVDGCNPVTYAVLDALDALRLPNPLVNVRLNQQSPPALLRQTCDLARRGLSQLAFYNDDAVVPALASANLPVEDARNWALDACQDILIEGRAAFYGQCVELTPLVLETLKNASETCPTFEAFLGLYKQKLSARVAAVAEGARQTRRKPLVDPHPFLSATIDDCIAKGLDCEDGGYRYSHRGIFLGSPVNAINSLAALKQVVYDRKSATLAEVATACQEDFKDRDTLRSMLLAAPKWGNDDDEVDLIGKDIIEFGCHEIQKQRVDDYGTFLSGVHQAWHVTTGQRTPATPDGRKAGEGFPVTLSPVNGTAGHGPTAIMKSVTKIDPMVLQWNCSLTLGFHATALVGDAGLAKFEMLLKTYLSLGGVQLQLNVIDVNALRAAQKNPDQYRDLVVRVWGYCARFVDLRPEYQEDIIARTLAA